MKEEKIVSRYFCKKNHLNGNMYHYSDEVIYEKHLENESQLQLKNEEGEYV